LVFLLLFRPAYKSQIGLNFSDAPPIYYKNLLVFAFNATLVVNRREKTSFWCKIRESSQKFKKPAVDFSGQRYDNKEAKIGQG
jgi:hypothetical protein